MITTLRGKTIFYFLIIFHLYKTSAFKIIDVEDLPKPRELNFENNFVFKDNPPEYSRFLDHNEIENENLKHRYGFNSLNVEDSGFKNKILVKRKLPHGIPPTGVEYDQNFDTVYKPLVRIHKTKSINQFLNEITQDSKHERVVFVISSKPNYDKLEPNQDLNEHFIKPNVIQTSFDFNDKSKLLKLLHDRIKNIKEPSKHNFEYENKRLEINKFPSLSNAVERSENIVDSDAYNKPKLLKEFHNKLRRVKSKSKRLIAFAKALNVLNDVLRTPQLEMSGEVHDPLAPGQQMLEKDEKQKQPKKWIPHYPPWNYWTYKKTIHEDECPGTQVKIGNMCIYTPPH